MHRRDGIAFGLIALAVVCAIGTWLQAAGPVGAVADDAVRVWIGALAIDLPDRPGGGRGHPDAHRARSGATPPADRRRCRGDPVDHRHPAGAARQRTCRTGTQDTVGAPDAGRRHPRLADRPAAVHRPHRDPGDHPAGPARRLRRAADLRHPAGRGARPDQGRGRPAGASGASRPTRTATTTTDRPTTGPAARCDWTRMPTWPRPGCAGRRGVGRLPTPSTPSTRTAIRTSIRTPRPVRWRPGRRSRRRYPPSTAPGPAGPGRSGHAVIRTRDPRSVPTRRPPRPTQLRLDQIGGNGYQLPPADLLKLGAPPKVRSAANDDMIERDHRRARAVQRRRRGHRLHPRPDRHPLRGRARARRQGREDHRADPQHRLRRRHRQRPAAGADPRQVRRRHRGAQLRPGDGPARRRAGRARRAGPITIRWSSGSARTSRATSSPPTSPRPRTCWSPAPPAPASRASSTRCWSRCCSGRPRPRSG